MRRTLSRLRAIVVAAAFALGSIPVIAPTAVLGSATNCGDIPVNDGFVAAQTPAATATGVKAYIDPSEASDGFHYCNGIDDAHGSFAWVSLTANSDPNGIVQLGFSYCGLDIGPTEMCVGSHANKQGCAREHRAGRHRSNRERVRWAHGDAGFQYLICWRASCRYATHRKR